MTSRKKRRERAQTPLGRLSRGTCLNCGERGPHFVPPSFGDVGFFICKPESKDERSDHDGA